jgi:hypothetical protein
MFKRNSLLNGDRIGDMSIGAPFSVGAGLQGHLLYRGRIEDKGCWEPPSLLGAG